MCHAKLTFEADTGQEIIVLGDSDLIITKTNITFTIQRLRENRHYNVTVTASNIAGSATSQAGISKLLASIIIVSH